MASLAGSGSEGVKDLMRKLESELNILELRIAFSGVKSNYAQFKALVDSYHVDMTKIRTLVEIVLRILATPYGFSQLDGEVKGLSLLVRSLAKIECCTQRWRCCMSSFSELLDSDVASGSSSRMRFFLPREFFFSVDLARMAFVIFMVESKIHLDKSWGSRSQSRSQIEEDFCTRAAHELFEWCDRKCRPVLKQHALDLGQEFTQHIVLNEPAPYPWTGLFSAWNIWPADLASESEEPSAEPIHSLPLEIDVKDVHNQVIVGQGAFGAVFRCRWRGQLAAMKTMTLVPEEPAHQQKFEMEVKIMASFQHPNAVPVFGYGYTEGRAIGFFVMEHMETDLEKVIRERSRNQSRESGVFPLDVAVDIMSQIVEGMCGLRRRRVIHRDLKPANILVNRPDESMGPLQGFYDVKLADFGCSKVGDDLDSVFGTLRMGTPAYMAPEVMSGTSLPERNSEQGYSWKADVYSFAMVCAEILSGERPFGHLRRMDTILKAVRGGVRPELRLDGGDPLRRLIEDCWKFNAEERPDFGDVRRRLWECRVYHFFTAEEGPKSWQAFLTLMDMEGEQAAMEIKQSRSSALIPGLAYNAWNGFFRWMKPR